MLDLLVNSFMKYIVILLLSFPLLLKAQDCKLHKETDPYTKEIKISSGFIQLQNGSVTIDADATQVDIFFSLTGTDKCFDNNSTAAIFFEGSKLKMTTRNAGSMNCEGFFHFNFRNTPSTNSLLQKIATQKISSILFTGNSKQETRLNFSTEQQPVVVSFTSCVVEEAKKLIK